MKIRDRQGNVYKNEDEMEAWLEDIYSSPVSRACMKVLSSPFVSRAGGILLNSKLSASYIYTYAEKHNIDMFDYEDKIYRSFNDFFTRRLKTGRRVIDGDGSALICPSDGKVSAYRIADSDMFVIKNSVYNVASLLRDKKLAKKYAGGTAVIIRLTPDDYHHYVYPADGIKSHNRKIEGALNTVRPTVNKYLPVYKENSREYCMIRTERFGDIIQMEVGAMMVGKISNDSPECIPVRKGEEKGHFEFGGSTIVLLLEAGRAKVCADLIDSTKHGYETKLRLGDVIARTSN
jgi:phosphatidylserine decarboxylase